MGAAVLHIYLFDGKLWTPRWHFKLYFCILVVKWYYQNYVVYFSDNTSGSLVLCGLPGFCSAVSVIVDSLSLVHSSSLCVMIPRIIYEQTGIFIRRSHACQAIQHVNLYTFRPEKVAEAFHSAGRGWREQWQNIDCNGAQWYSRNINTLLEKSML